MYILFKKVITGNGQAYIGTNEVWRQKLPQTERQAFGMKTWTDRLVDIVFRGVVGLVVIYILEQLCLHNDFPVLAGVNAGTFLLTALLGMPGFLAVFVISLIYFY